MTSFRPFIPVFFDRDANTSTGDIILRLRESFTHCVIGATENSQKFFQSLEAEGTILAVLPGIVGEHSKYHIHVGNDGMDRLKKFVENGGILITACAGSYFITEQTQYTLSSGGLKTRKNSRALFNGTAYGPVGESINPPKSARQFEDITLTPVSYQGLDLKWHDTNIAYGNGPAYDGTIDKDTEVLARYKLGKDQPPAIIWKKIGKGAVLWLGALPYIGPLSASALTTEKQKIMFAALTANESGRQDLWNNITTRIRTHWSSRIPT